MATAKNTILAPLPDDIIHKILRFLPIKSAVRMRCVSKKFEDLWSIDLDEGDPPLDNPHQHTEFINNSETYLDSREKNRHVDKFRLRMMRYSPKVDDAVVSRYLDFAFLRNVMVLDISLRSKSGIPYYRLDPGFLEQNFITTLKLEYVRINIGYSPINLRLLKTMSLKSVILDSQNSLPRLGPEKKPLSRLVSACPNIENLSLNLKDSTHDTYCLSVWTLLGAKYITNLNLESVKIVDEINNISSPRHVPLKTMCLKTVHLHPRSLFGIISGSPSLEYLSLTSSSFPRGSSLQFSSSSLKTLEVTDCNAQQLNVSEAVNLESFTLVSAIPQRGSEIGQLARTALHGCENLKHVNIRAERLQDIVLGGCKDCVEATIEAPNLRYFNFSGNLKSTISMEAPNLLDARITLLCGNSTSRWRHFPTLVDFLKTFGHSKRILLHADGDDEVSFSCFLIALFLIC